MSTLQARGSAKTENYPDSDCPTEQRLKVGVTLEVVSQTTKAGRDRASEAWRVIPAVERLHRAGQISDAELAAAKRYFQDYVTGHRVSGLVANYGLTGGSSTASGSGYDAAQRRTDAHTRYVNASKWLGSKALRDCLRLYLCEDYGMDVHKPVTLVDIGRAVIAYRSDKQAQAVGTAVVKIALQKLADYYGLDND